MTKLSPIREQPEEEKEEVFEIGPQPVVKLPFFKPQDPPKNTLNKESKSWKPVFIVRTLEPSKSGKQISKESVVDLE